MNYYRFQDDQLLQIQGISRFQDHDQPLQIQGISWNLIKESELLNLALDHPYFIPKYSQNLQSLEVQHIL